MAFDLRTEVEELRKRGASLGLNHDDIDYAILKSLGETPKSNRTKHQGFSFCKCIFIVTATMFCLSFLIIGGVIVASEQNMQFRLFVGRTLADCHYPIVRLVRFITLPLHRRFDISYMHSWDCIIENPTFETGGPDCDICANAERVPTRSSELLPQEAFKAKYFDPGFSVIVRDVDPYGSKNHSYEEFLDLYRANKKNIDKDACQFYVGGENNSIHTLEEILDGWQHYSPEGHIIGWKFCYGKGFRQVRQLYPRPYFVHSEGSLEKVIELLQPAGSTPETVELPRTSFDNVWYAQVDGFTEVELAPVGDCEEQCKSHTVNLIKGDVLFFTQQVWKASFTNRAQSPAIVFVSSFA
ncbi:hypothetical protein QZH41_012252 [Actinostola sp. cb2023]|nr:hypothetical protein QZH41_012252 [Actinostola sp. cb2023]